MQSIYKIKGDTSDFDAKLRKSKANLTQFASSGKLGMEGMSKAIGGAMAKMVSWTSVAMAAGAVMKDMVQKNREFEQASANLAAILGTTRSEIASLTTDAKKLGATTMYTASQVTQLQTELAKLGFNQGEIKSATGDVLNLAAATGTDLATAAAQAGATLRGFGMNAAEMDRVASVLAVSTTKSALSMEKLGVALPIVQTTAAKTGFTIEDTAAMLGKLVDNGINAASAGTQLRKVLNDATTSGTKLAEALGGPVKGFDDLVAKLNNLSKANHKHADSVALVNSKNATALDILIDVSKATDGETSSLSKLRSELTGCNEALDGMVNEQMNTLEGSIKIMQSAWEGLMLSFSNSNSTLKSITDKLSELISQWTRARNLANGGMVAVAEFEQGGDKKYAKSLIDNFKSVGWDDKRIKAEIEKYKTQNETDLEKASEILTLFENETKKQPGDRDFTPLYDKLRSTFGKGAAADGDGIGWLYRFIAGKNDKISTYGMALGMLESATVTGGSEENNQSEKESLMRKRLKNEEAIAIAAQTELLQKKQISEEEYESKVYEIKRNSLLKQQSLYQEGTSQYFEIGTSIQNLDTQRMMSQFKGDNKTKTVKQTVSLGKLGQLEDLAATIEKSMQFADTNDELQTMIDKLKEVKKQIADIKGTQVDAADKSQEAWECAASAISSVGSALSSLDNPAAKVMGIIAQAIANIAAGYAAAVAKAGATGDAGGPWGWIAFAASGAATMVSSIAAIKSATEYHADGGFVGMNGLKRGTDIVPAMLTPGELVLNAAQQSTLAGQLQGGYGNLHIEKVIGAEEIRLILTNNNRRRGRQNTSL